MEEKGQSWQKILWHFDHSLGQIKPQSGNVVGEIRKFCESRGVLSNVAVPKGKSTLRKLREAPITGLWNLQ